jgi:hypothetical protein
VSVLSERSFARRGFIAAALAFPLGACIDMSDMFGGNSHPYTLTPRGDRMVRWLQNEGKENMMAPDSLGLMGITNEGRDIPVKQFAEEGNDGRYVISLVWIRKVNELVLLRKQSEDLLILHHCDTAFRRLESVRYPRNGKPSIITDSAFAENDFQQQLAFWFDRMPGR